MKSYKKKLNTNNISQGREKAWLNLHAGRFDISAETEHEIPKLVKAPLINPHGKYRSMLVVWAAVSPNGAESLSVASVLSADGSRETRVSHRKWLS